MLVVSVDKRRSGQVLMCASGEKQESLKSPVSTGRLRINQLIAPSRLMSVSHRVLGPKDLGLGNL